MLIFSLFLSPITSEPLSALLEVWNTSARPGAPAPTVSFSRRSGRRDHAMEEG